MDKTIPELEAQISEQETNLSATQERSEELQKIITEAEEELGKLQKTETQITQEIGSNRHQIKILLAEEVLSTSELTEFASKIPGVVTVEKGVGRSEDYGPSVTLVIEGTDAQASLNFFPTQNMLQLIQIGPEDATTEFSKITNEISQQVGVEPEKLYRDKTMRWHNIDPNKLSQ